MKVTEQTNTSVLYLHVFLCFVAFVFAGGGSRYGLIVVLVLMATTPSPSFEHKRDTDSVIADVIGVVTFFRAPRDLSVMCVVKGLGEEQGVDLVRLGEVG